MSALPRAWECAPLVEICAAINTGRRPKGGVRGIQVGVLSLGGEHVSERGHVDLATPRYIPHVFAEGIPNARVAFGDTLVVKDGATTGRVAIADERFHELPAYVNEHLFLCRAAREIEPSYIFSYLRSQGGRAAILSDFRGAAQGGISREFARKVIVPVAPLPEQQRILAKINSLSRKSKRACNHLNHIPQLVGKYNEAILDRAFRGELTCDMHGSDIACASFIAERKSALASKMVVRPWNGRKFAGEDLPEVPKNWRWFLVGDIVIHRAGIAFQSSDFCTEGKQVVRLGNLYQGILDLSRQPVFLKDAEKYRAFFATPGDLLVSQTGTKYKRDYGHFVAVPDQVGNLLINQRILCLTCIQDINPKFLLFYSRTRLFREYFFSKETGGVNQGNVGVSGIMDAPIPLPSFSEQAEIVRRIETAFAWIDCLASETTSARRLIDHLDQAVLAKAFRGELVPQDPNDEPASILLARIRAQRANGPSKTPTRARRP